MGVYDTEVHPHGMHWQQPSGLVGPCAYHPSPSRDVSPNLPAENSMGDTTDYSACCNNNQCSTGGGCGYRGGYPSLPFIKPEYHNNNDARCEVKRERVSPPSPQETSDPAESGFHCGGCGRRITDRYYLAAVDRKWHAACLQCCHCRVSLDGEVTCFTRQGNIYCKKDYYRTFVMKRCGRCQAAISSSELVMRARDLVYHIPCFTCSVCTVPLSKGDQFGLREGSVFCRAHFDLSDLEPPSSYAHYPTPYSSPEFHPSPVPPPPGSTNDVLSNKVPFFNGAVQAAPRQKGRPRKRKPKDLEALTANLDLNETTYLDYGRGGPGTPGMTASGRSKRMRTSFKHHQLRTMKSYFSINHNPDAKDLKQLSQKTSLPKRVLQVWFQNARAKWRRMMSKQEGKSDKGSESGGLSDLESYPSHPAGGSMDSLGSHSPPYMMGGQSPQSLECT